MKGNNRVRSEKDILASVPTKLFIGGDWVDAEGGKTLNVSDPATGEHLATIANASEADAKKAMDAASDVQESWETLLRACAVRFFARRGNFSSSAATISLSS